MPEPKYTEEDIKTLEWREHIRLRPGMYIGKRGDGSAPDDGIYVLFKEVIDNCIDEFVMGHGKTIEVKLDGDTISVRDYGEEFRSVNSWIVLPKLILEQNMIRKLFKSQLVSMESASRPSMHCLKIFRFKHFVKAKQNQFHSLKQRSLMRCSARSSKASDGTYLSFSPDDSIFNDYKWREFIDNMLWNYAYLNSGLTLNLPAKI